MKMYVKLYFACSLFFFNSARSQTILTGGVVVIGWNELTNVIRLATLVNIPSGTVLKITDKGWDNGTFAHAFTSGNVTDGIVTWTTASIIPSGTVLSLYLGGTNMPATPTTLTNVTTGTSLTASITVSGYTGPDPITTSGDGVFIYQGSNSNPFFIYGFNNTASVAVDASGWNTAIVTESDSQLPNGTGSQNALTNGVNAAGMPGALGQLDNIQYTGPVTSANGNTWLARFANVANWSGDNTGVITSTISSSFALSGVLPVSLLRFNARQRDNGILLDWDVATETVFKQYEIEKSNDRIHFSAASIVPAAGQQHYEWVDASNTTGTLRLFYRLKMTDVDGSYKYSAVVIVSLHAAGDFVVSTSASADLSRVVANLNMLQAGNINITINNMADLTVFQQKAAVLKGVSTVYAEPSKMLPAGVYLLVLEYEGKRVLRKIVK